MFQNILFTNVKWAASGAWIALPSPFPSKVAKRLDEIWDNLTTRRIHNCVQFKRLKYKREIIYLRANTILSALPNYVSESS